MKALAARFYSTAASFYTYPPSALSFLPVVWYIFFDLWLNRNYTILSEQRDVKRNLSEQRILRIVSLLLDILEECSLSDLVDRIEVTIKEKKLTFNRVEHELGFGNGTIKRWKEQSPRLDKLIKVAEYLNVSLDYIAFGTLQTDNSTNGVDIPSL